MFEIFISYARSTQNRALTVAECCARWDTVCGSTTNFPLTAHTRVIQERLQSAKAVVVIWSAEAAQSEWVRSEANRAREARKLVQLSIGDAKLPMPFDQIQCADMNGWTGDLKASGWRKVVASIAELTGRATRENGSNVAPTARTPSACCRSST